MFIGRSFRDLTTLMLGTTPPVVVAGEPDDQVIRFAISSPATFTARLLKIIRRLLDVLIRCNTPEQSKV